MLDTMSRILETREILLKQLDLLHALSLELTANN